MTALRKLSSVMQPSWRLVAIGISNESILGLVLLNILINYLDEETKSTVSNFDDDTKLREVADTPEGSCSVRPGQAGELGAS